MSIWDRIRSGVAKGIRDAVEDELVHGMVSDYVAERKVRENVIPDIKESLDESSDDYTVRCRDASYDDVLTALETRRGTARLSESPKDESGVRNSILESYRDGSDYLDERLPSDDIRAVKAVDVLEDGQPDDHINIMYYMLSGEDRFDTYTAVFPRHDAHGSGVSSIDSGYAVDSTQ